VNLKPKTRNPKRPHVVVNMSMTADGKIATTNRAVSSFSSKRDHDHLLELRATADAVICGARTVDLNKVDLGPGGPKFRKLRLKRGLAEHNLRIIVTGSGTLNPAAHIFRTVAASRPSAAIQSKQRPAFPRVAAKHRPPIIVLTTARAGKFRLAKLQAVADEVNVFGQKEFNLRAALAWLRRKWKVRRLICEGGGELNDAMFRAGFVDEFHLTICPRIIGGREAPTLADGKGFSKLIQAARLSPRSARQQGDELLLTYSRI
jgi:2,5-diamino-6-(ribosylamino)-4(3H)-pyrimidinone 5'-phosphate reductase